MFYEPGRTPHGLPHDPFKSCVIPRPIGWISTVDRAGRHNLAPFSQFQNVSFDPPIVMFSANQNSAGERKDSVRNAEDGGEFVWNMATWAQREAVNISAEELPHGVDEFERAGLAKLPSLRVKPPRVAGSPIQFECVYLNTLRFPGGSAMGTADVVFGRVVGAHIADAALTPEGLVDVLKIQPSRAWATTTTPRRQRVPDGDPGRQPGPAGRPGRLGRQGPRRRGRLTRPQGLLRV